MRTSLARLTSKLPRGGFHVVKRLGLKNLPVSTDVGVLQCDLAESVCYPLLKYGTYPHAQKEFAFYREFVKRGDVVFDVGANIGYTTKLFVGCGARVVAFEPSPKAFSLLRRSCAGDDNIVLHNVAASKEAGFAYFAELDSLDRSHVSAYGIRVETARLDSFDPTPNFIKVDVEGHEPDVFKGATSFLKKGVPILFEALREERLEACKAVLLEANQSYRVSNVEGNNYFATVG